MQRSISDDGQLTRPNAYDEHGRSRQAYFIIRNIPSPPVRRKRQNEQAGKGEKGDVEPRPVVPRDVGLDDSRMALRWDETETAENEARALDAALRNAFGLSKRWLAMPPIEMKSLVTPILTHEQPIVGLEPDGKRRNPLWGAPKIHGELLNLRIDA